MIINKWVGRMLNDYNLQFEGNNRRGTCNSHEARSTKNLNKKKSGEENSES